MRKYITHMPKMGGLFIVLVLMLTSIAANAQTAASYIFSRTAGTYTSISGTGTLITTSSFTPVSGSILSDDGNTASIPIGFSFNFCGATYTSVSGCANGVLSLSNNGATYTISTGNISGPGFIMAMWTDDYGLPVTAGTPAAYYQTTGIAPNRVFTIEWNDWNTYATGNGGTSSDHLNWQVSLFEGTNKVQISYGSAGTPTTGVVGIANSTTDYQTLTSGASTTCNSSFNNPIGQPANGSVLTWAPIIFDNGPAQSLSVCESSAATSINSLLTASTNGGTTFSWTVISGPTHGSLSGFPASASVGTSVSPTGTTYQPTGGYSGPDAFTIQVDNGVGDAVTTTITVTVNPLPVPTFSAGPGGTICAGTTTTYTTQASQSNYLWSVPGVGGVDYTITGGGIGTGSSTVSLYWNTAGSQNVTVNYTDGNGCTGSSAASNTTTVNSRPVPTFSAGPGGTICAGTTTTYTTQASQSNYLWSVPGVGGVDYTITGGGIGTGSNTVSLYWNTAGSQNVTVNYTDGNGCTGAANASNSTTVNTRPTPTFTTSPGVSICTGTSVTYTTQAAQTSYVWSVPGTGGGVDYTITGGGIGGASNTVTLTWVSTGSKAVTVNYTDGNGCTGASNASNTTLVNPYSAIYAITGGGPYCSGGAGSVIGLSGSDVGIDYQLYKGAAISGSVVAGTGAAISFGPRNIGSTGYNVVAIGNPSGCTNNMSGTATVSILTSPAVVSVTGGGTVCGGGPGVTVGLSGSAVGINYQLYLGASTVGSAVGGVGSGFNFGTYTAIGTYTVTATNPGNGCVSNMSGSAVITAAGGVTAFAVTGGGSYCSGGTGVAVGLANSVVGVSYQLFFGASAVGSAVAGTGAAISFGLQTGAGSYTVVGTNTTTSCTGNMTGSATVTINSLPTGYAVTGGGAYCSGGSGVSVGLSSSQSGVNYQLYNGASTVGSPVAGTGSAVSFGLVTAAGTYTVTATNTTTTCTNGMLSSVTVSVNPLPTVATGAGSVTCAGSPASLTASGATTYAWTPATALSATTGSSITASPVTTTTYTVTGTDINGCSNTATVTITVNPIPVISGGSNVAICIGSSTGLTASGTSVSYTWTPAATLSASTGASVTATPTVTTTYTVTGTAAGCNNTATVTVTVNSLPTVSGGANVAICGGSSTGLTASGAASYTWSPAAGLSASTGASVTATPTVTTTYTITGTSAASCINTGTVTVTVNPLPTNYAMTGGGSYCSGTAGVSIGLANSDAGINYQLYRAGSIAVGSPVAGTGAAISFGTTFTTAGTYTVIATNATTSCTLNISGSVTVTPYTSPAIVSVTGGGSYCTGGTGVNIGLTASATGVNYQLYLGASTVGSPVAGVGSSLSFGLITVAGTYTVTATNATSGCVSNMSGSATVSVYAALTTYSVTGGGSYCSGGTGVSVGLSGSDAGVNYQLYRGGVPLVGTTTAGTGAAISFGLQTVAGTYTVVATSASNGCTANMSSSAVITINSLPTAYTMTGGGSYCSGGAGLAVGLSSSQSGVNYQLYSGASTVGSPVAGTGSAISFGTLTAAGTYTVTATNTTTSCTNAMSGGSTITINALPTVYTVSGGGSYCSGAGLHILLSGSNAGINYQLYNGASTVGSPVAGTGSGLDFGAFTTPGTYTVVATNATTSCTSNMSGSGTITGVSLPTAYTMTGGGSYCSGGTGVAVGLSNSDIGVNYQLYRGVTTAVGSVVAGTGSAISFGLQTTGGSYTVVATNVSLGCTSNMTGTSTVTVNPPPATVAVTGGGSYCSGGSGVAVGLTGSAVGIDYQLYRGATTVGSPVAGIGGALSFGLMTVAGTYTVTATNTSTTCSGNMSGSATVTVNSLPTVYSVTGGGSYCSGSTGVAIGLSNSQTGVNYQLYNGASTVGSPVSGSGIAITFGIQTAAGTYTVVATNASTSCAANMSGSATITINALPTVYTVTGGGGYCSGGAGAAIGLSNSDVGVNYQLYNGASTAGSPVAGTGAAISFGTFTLATTYTVTATNATTSCTRNMSGSATVSVYSLPASVSVTGGGTICVGGTGVAVGLSASASGVNYQLYVGATPTGSPVAGVGSSISFGLQTTAGTYTVIGTNTTTSCTNTMSGSAVINNYPVPTAFAMTGGGSYCSGGTGVAVGLAGSVSGTTYQLYRGASTVGSPLSGTGAALSFGLQTTAGTYTVVATTTSNGCTGNMTGSAVVSVNALPTAYTVTGGGGYCTGGTGVAIGLSNSTSGVDYQLYLGATPVGSAVSGTGSAISFGSTFTTAGTYTIVGTNTTTSCVNNMSGSAVVSINPLPTAYTVTGGGAYCSGPGVHIYLSNSTAGVNYQLYNGASTVGSPVAGTGAMLDFGAFSTLGTYTVTATNATTSCTNNMSGSAIVSGASLPAVYTVTGGGNYCSGGAGVAIGLSNSDLTISYQLYLGASTVGSPVSGTGSAISFGSLTAVGTYTVVATNTGSSCVSAMSGSATVAIDPLPTTYTMTGGGSYCSGGSGVAVGLSSSQSGVNYQLYRGASTVGSPVAGTGSSITFGLQTTAGTYTVVATDGTTSCAGNMSGSAVVSINALPTTYTVTGGGSFCAGGTGVAVGLSSSQSGVNYQLYNGATPIGSAVAGTGAAISFGLQTSGGTYTVVATNTTTLCTNNMTGSATVTVNPLPNNYAITGGGSFCSATSGVAIGLAGSDAGVNYQLYRAGVPVGSAVPGTGSAISFGSTFTISGTYTIVATNATTSCTFNITGSTTITAYTSPAIVSVTGGGTICIGGTGVAVGLAASATGINYQLYLGASTVGSPVAGVGGSLSFGLQTGIGTYTVTATNPTSGCTSNMSGSAVINNYPVPTAFAVTGSGSYCSGGTGVVVGLAGSVSGNTYQLYRGATAVGSPLSGTGSSLSFGLQTIAGTYTVVATTTSNGCTGNMTGSAVISINALPTAYTVTGGGGYCTGGTGVAIGLSNSTIGVNYQLYIGASTVGSPVAGTGAAISFGSTFTTAGIYTVVATNTTTSCVNNMSGSATVTINPLPTAYTVTGGGSYCSGPGVHIYLSNSTVGVNYQLYNGVSTVGSPVAGTGTTIDFGAFPTVGTYTVTATNATTSCINNMSGSATISGVSLPTVYSVTGGGSYCSGGTGVAVGVSNSDVGVTYQLYLGASTVGSPVAGTGAALSLGLQTAAGTYTVLAINAGSSCTSSMTGSATVSIDPLPTIYTVTGGGSYCSGGSGVAIGLSSSQSGVNYQLYRGASTVGSPVAGTGSAITFGLQTTAGTYTVVAIDGTTSCTSNMSSSATITVLSLPTAYTVTGGGSYCSGGTGVAVRLSSSQSGVNYQLYNGATPVGSAVAGTGAALSFGLQTASGTYTVVATNTTTTCTNNMTGSATVTINALPTLYTVTGGGGYCTGGTGVAIGLSNSDAGVNYQLYRGATAVGSPVAGTGSAISFGLQTIAGTYTVIATNATTSCTRTMSGSTSVVINSLPTVVSVTGGGSYCSGGSGVAIGLSGSIVGVNYQLYLGASTVGSPVAGVGGTISFGSQTAVGTYTVTATNATTGCSSNMSGSATVSIYPALFAFTVTGGGSYCSGGTGVTVGLSSTVGGTNYQLYRGGLPVVGSTVSGTGAPISFGLQTVGGTYTVVGTNTSTGCTGNMSGSVVVTVNPQPTAYTVTGGGSYCSGGAGVAVGLASSASGINYQLYRGATAVGSPVAGTGSALSFGAQTVAGTYTVTATDATTGCTNTMSGSVSVSISSLPAIFTVTGGGSYCSGGTGPHVYLSSSTGLTNYQLYLGASPVGSPVAGTGSTIDFGVQSAAGTYTVVATGTSTGCTNNMSGSATVSVIALPTIYTVTGGGSYCPGGSGVAVGLASSNSGISYQLYRGATMVGSAVAGTGSALSFGLQTTAGTYTVVATTTGTACTSNMSGSAVIAIYSSPSIFSVTGGGSYCVGGSGVAVGLSSTTTSVNYQLYLGATPVGSPVAGTGTTITFGLQTTAGTYTVIATSTTTGCASNMSGSATIIVNALPTVYTVTGGGSYCSGGSGVVVGLSSSQSGVNYQLYLGASTVGIPVAGTGSAISFGFKTAAGTYTVVATNASTACTNNMTGSATISINALPTIYTVTGGGNYCSGGTGIAVGLSSSQTGVNYQLYRSTTAVGSPVAGTGSAISFGLQTVAATYTVVASNPTTGCTANMSGSASITISSVPTICSVTGGGSYCSGGSGVHIGLGASISGVNYQLYLGASTVGSPVGGVGGSLDFGLLTTAGTYTVTATNASGCTSNMSGSVTITVNSLPTAFTVTGGGGYCSGGTGVSIGLSSSVSGISYKLYQGATPVSSSISGTGSALNFGLYTSAGTYTVIATNSVTGCTNTMSGSTTVTVNPVPTLTGSIYTLMPGASITLTGSPSGGNYTSSITSVATVGLTSGIVTGVSLGTTNITYTLPTGCLAVHSVAVTPTGFRESPAGTTTVVSVLNESSIYIMPNPNKGTFSIKGQLLAETDEELSLDITNMLGQNVYSDKLIVKDGVIDAQVHLTGSMANGMYLITLRSGTESKVFHMVIEQ